MNDSGDNDKTRLIKPSDIPHSDDRTRIAITQPQSPNDAKAPQGQPFIANNADDDKTRMAPSIKDSLVLGDDKTQFKPKDQLLENSDKTRFVSRASDEMPRADATPSDITQFVSSSVLLSPSSDATKLTSKPSSASDSMLSDDSGQEYPVLKNRFVFEELLGVGGMGAVYKAKDLLKVEAQDRDPYVAIKVLNDEFKSHPEAFIALQRESRKSQRIAHPNIVNVYDFDRDGDTVFMTMEYMEGKPLDKLISQYRNTGLPHEEVMKIIEGICAALIYAHEQKIIHSDFKPGNIFVNNQGFAKVFDFGIARAVARADHREPSLDDRTVFDAGKLGALTPAYASLEMLEGLAPDTRDDVYALGCIAYELFTGVHPYNRIHANEAKRQKLKPKKIPGIPNYQWKAIERAVAIDRVNRTESVQAFWRELSKRKLSLIRIAAVFVVLLGLGAGAYYKFKPEAKKLFSEAEVRSEIEAKLRLELKMKSLTDLLSVGKLSSAIEAQLWVQVQELRQILGKGNAWLVSQETAIYTLYVKEIGAAIGNKDFNLAATLTANAYRYAVKTEQLKNFEILIAKGIDEKNRQDLARLDQKTQQRQQTTVIPQPVQEQKVPDSIAERNNLFQVGLSSVNTQLACQSNIDMKDFDIAITKLKTLNAASYLNEEPRITSLLAKCIVHIGSAFPERALAAKSAALRIFNGHPTIAAIVIAQRDPCSPTLAGLGSRGGGSSCKDKIAGVSKVPAMVVIPAKDSVKIFAIGKYEVSVDELNEFCQQSKTCESNQIDEGSLPATSISLSTANGYVKWLSEKSNRKYRLPTLVEWQYAAKGNTGRIDQNRNCKLNSRGIQKGNSLIKVSIGQQNDWGLVNYIGNAREWVVDGGGVVAVGGSFETAMEDCDINNKSAQNGRPDNITGFRVLREVSGQE